MNHAFPTKRLALLLALLLMIAGAGVASAQPVATTADSIPLPEHPRPDFERPQWQNLNGPWQFRFDRQNRGLEEEWFRPGAAAGFDQMITVPFPWGSPLSEVENGEPEIGWYARSVEVPEGWSDRRVFLVIGAADWKTTAWLGGERLGPAHEGGYTPFEFELTDHLEPGQEQRLVLRVDDRERAFKLEGKQGYGNARGIWQTPYLEARGSVPLEHIHFTPRVAGEAAGVVAKLERPAPQPLQLRLDFQTGGVETVTRRVAAGQDSVAFDVSIPDPHLWTLEDPFLYEVEAHLSAAADSVSADSIAADEVSTYFGMRTVGVERMPGTDFPYVSLNGEPIYLEMALDQAYHPEGFYAFPSDKFVRNDVWRTRKLGLGGQRIHVKVGIPRKLYWADKLGVLIMADVPNSWGEPTDSMRQEVEYALRQMIERDYNHPSIFSWVPFNETWGLRTAVEEDGDTTRQYLPETQEWVASVYDLAGRLDSTRLVEDNSPCCGLGHTRTDLNSWHAYLPGWAWDDHLDEVTSQSEPGSGWNYEEGYTQQPGTPLINSEFGNVWGYEGSTGDVDFSWDYHRALNAFRRHPEVAGWLYTQHHDVVNEWNGYYRYDRSEKITGLSELAEGMSLADLHSPLYVAPGGPLSREVAPGDEVQVPLWASFMTGRRAYGDSLRLRARLHGWDDRGRHETYWQTGRRVAYQPWRSEAMDTLSVPMPGKESVAVLSLFLEDAPGHVLHRNVTTFVVRGDTAAPAAAWQAEGNARLMRVAPGDFDAAEWSAKQWDVMGGLKVNGAGHGFFEYRLPWPEGVQPEDVASATFLVEASAKELFAKDRGDAQAEGDYMRGGGAQEPSANPNAYPMTDTRRSPSAVTVRLGGVAAERFELADDPADHRGILSWHAQRQDRRLREAGSYGELLRVNFSQEALQQAADAGELVLRLEVDEALPGGLALYGRRFGRYPLGPTLMLKLKGNAPDATQNAR